MALPVAPTTDIFQTNINIGKGWKLDGAILNFGIKAAAAAGAGAGAAPAIDYNGMLLATSLSMQYNRGTEQINPINQNKRYTVASDPTGTIQIGAVVGPSADIATFVKQFGDVCKLAENNIIITPTGTQKCGAAAGVGQFKAGEQWIASGALITGISMSIQKTAGGNMVIAGLTISFLKLEIK
jgi:hypothetical protein